MRAPWRKHTHLGIPALQAPICRRCVLSGAAGMIREHAPAHLSSVVRTAQSNCTSNTHLRNTHVEASLKPEAPLTPDAPDATLLGSLPSEPALFWRFKSAMPRLAYSTEDDTGDDKYVLQTCTHDDRAKGWAAWCPPTPRPRRRPGRVRFLNCKSRSSQVDFRRASQRRTAVAAAAGLFATCQHCVAGCWLQRGGRPSPRRRRKASPQQFSERCGAGHNAG
eukprot:363116-Chlamydomonas_euryale.AAC.6